MSEENTELFDADGNVIEGAMTADQVQTKLEEFTKEKDTALETLKTEHDTKTQELQGKIDELTDEMEKLTKKDVNFEKLRKQKEGAEELLKKVEEKFKGEFDGIKKEVREGKLDAAIKNVIGTDPELHEKVKEFYNNFKGEPKDKEEMSERIKNAYTLATGSAPKDPLSSDVIGTGGGQPSTPSQYKGKISEGAMDVAKNLGITEEELKKEKLI